MWNKDNGGRGSCESEKVQISAISHLQVRTGGHYSWKHKTPSANEAGQTTAATVEMIYMSFWDTRQLKVFTGFIKKKLLYFYENEILQMLGFLWWWWWGGSFVLEMYFIPAQFRSKVSNKTTV